MAKHIYQVVVGNVGTMDYTSNKLAVDCFKTYRTMSMQGITSAAHEPVTLLKDGEIIEEYIPVPVKFLIHETGTDIDLFAFFPNTMESYSHIGQHSDISYGYVDESREATSEEYKELHAELISIGYASLITLNTSIN